MKKSKTDKLKLEIGKGIVTSAIKQKALNTSEDYKKVSDILKGEILTKKNK